MRIERTERGSNRLLKYHAKAMKTLMLWCSPEHPPPRKTFTVYWHHNISDQERNAGNISLPEMINQGANYWKPRYLSWLDIVGKSSFRSKTVVDSMTIRPGLSYWWMTIPSEYSFSPSTIAYATLRLWALAQIVEGHNVEQLRVEGADAALKEVLTLWCNKTGRQIAFTPGQVINKRESHIKTTSSIVKKRLPAFIKGIGFLVWQYLQYFSVHRPQHPAETADEPALAVVDYFTNFDVKAAHAAIYTSNYWGPLTTIFPPLGPTVNWIHIGVKSPTLPDSRSARDAIRGLNRGNSSSRHVLLQDYLTLRVAFSAAAQFLRIRRVTRQAKKGLSWVDPISGVDVFPLVRSRLHSDFHGAGAAKNALWLSLFEEALPAQSAQDPCIYLMENQPWELALLHTRRTRSAGPNVGFAHVPVRTWDLRYALGLSTVSDENSHPVPRPSHVAVIDLKSETVMMANGMKPSEIVKVEALRFLSLMSTPDVTSNNPTDVLPNQRVLIFGEYDASMYAKQLQILEELAPLVREKWTFTFRPHPAIPRLQWSLPAGVSLSERLRAIDDLAECDVAFCSNFSSAALDASLMGIPVVMFMDGRGFNGSPLSPGPSVYYVSNAAEVIVALEKIETKREPQSWEKRYPMHLDSALTRWRTLLDSLMRHKNE